MIWLPFDVILCELERQSPVRLGLPDSVKRLRTEKAEVAE